MIRILYVIDSLMAGGIEQQMVEMATRLDRDRFEPHVLALYGPATRDMHFAPQLEAAGISVHTLDLGWGAADKARGVAGIIRTVRAIKPRIIQSENYHANLLTRLARPFLGHVRLIGSVRGVHTTKQLRYERLSQPFHDRIVVNAGHLKTMLMRQAGLPERKVVHIPNGINLPRFANATDEGLRQAIAPNARLLFITLGRIAAEKNTHLTIQGLGRLRRQGQLPPDVKYVIAGAVQEEEAQHLIDEAISADNLADVVTQYPPTDHPEHYFQAGDVTIVFSSPVKPPAEGLPSVMLESLAAGKPVLASEVANAAEVIRQSETGWVARTGDVMQLTETLRQIIDLPDADRERMRIACQRDAQEYAVELMVERYMTLYTSLA